jgi:hypothetical protein
MDFFFLNLVQCCDLNAYVPLCIYQIHLLRKQFFFRMSLPVLPRVVFYSCPEVILLLQPSE